MKEIKIPYKPRTWAVPFHNSLKRFSVLVLHRRLGKTTAIVNHLQRACLNDALERQRLKFLAPELRELEKNESGLRHLLRNRFYAHILPTYKQAKLVVWDMLKYYSKPIPGIKINESELMITYPNNSRLALFGADNPDSFRGIGPSGLAFDEYSQHPSNIFSEVLSKALADHLGFAIFSGTIIGKNQLYKTYKAFENDENAFTLWQDIDKTIQTETGVTIMTIKRALEDDRKLVSQGLMSQEEFDQEWYLSPTGALRGAIYVKEISELNKSGRIGIFPYNANQLVHDVWDLGKGKKMAVGFYQRAFDQVRMIDYLEGDDNDGLPQMIKKVKEKPYVFGKHFAPHDIKAVDLSTGKTRIETAKELGWNFIDVPNIGVSEGINAAKFMFSRLFINSACCEKFIEYISQYRREWDEKHGSYRDIPLHDFTSHAADQFRYAAVVENLMVNELDNSESIEYNQAALNLDPWH